MKKKIAFFYKNYTIYLLIFFLIHLSLKHNYQYIYQLFQDDQIDINVICQIPDDKSETENFKILLNAKKDFSSDIIEMSDGAILSQQNSFSIFKELEKIFSKQAQYGPSAKKGFESFQKCLENSLNILKKNLLEDEVNEKNLKKKIELSMFQEMRKYQCIKKSKKEIQCCLINE